MDPCATASVSLRIEGRDLNPDEITRLLGQTPNHSHRFGDLLRRTSRREVFAESGVWSLQFEEHDPENVDAEIRLILSNLNPGPDVWEELSRRYDVQLFCGYFMRSVNHELLLSPSTLTLLGLRRITLRLDIYEGESEDRDA